MVIQGMAQCPEETPPTHHRVRQSETWQLLPTVLFLFKDEIGKQEEPMPTRNINLTEHFDRFVEEQIDAGKYKNASEVLRAGLRLLEQQTQTEEEKLALLQKLAADGFRSLDQGQGLSIAGEGSLRKAISKIGRRAAKASKARRAE